MRFLIEKDGAFYLTQGKLLVYDPAAAKDDEQKQGVDKVGKAFKKIHDEPHTWYKAVQVRDGVDIAAINTGEAN